jgi:hypothetical protein
VEQKKIEQAAEIRLFARICFGTVIFLFLEMFMLNLYNLLMLKTLTCLHEPVK